MGGTMKFGGVAEVITKGITHGQVNGKMDGLSMAVASPTTPITSMVENNAIPPTKQMQPLYPIHEVTEEMIKEFSCTST
jgi:hypothetical protein